MSWRQIINKIGALSKGKARKIRDNVVDPNLGIFNMVALEKVRHERIARRAYFLWEEAGKPDGDGRSFWLSAENELDIVFV